MAICSDLFGNLRKEGGRGTRSEIWSEAERGSQSQHRRLFSEEGKKKNLPSLIVSWIVTVTITFS